MLPFFIVKTLKRKGIYLERHAQRNKKISIAVILIGIIASISFLLCSPFIAWFFIWWLFIIIFPIGRFFLHRYKNFKKGLEGENMVATTLKQLSDEYYLINDIKFPDSYGNIDHIVLGPNGIFVIETKNYTGEIICNGDKWIRRYTNGWSYENYDIGSPSKQVKRNAWKIKELIEMAKILDKPIWVEGIVVFTNPDVDLNIEAPTVPILKLDELYYYIKNKGMEIKFSREEIKKIGKIILDNAT